MMPHINAPDGEVNLLPGVLLLGLATLLLTLGVKGGAFPSGTRIGTNTKQHKEEG